METGLDDSTMDREPTYWLILFSIGTWQEFINSGASEMGFRDHRWKIMENLEPGDYLICYLTGVARFVGLLKTVSQPFKSDFKIWTMDLFPCRVRVSPVMTLIPEAGVPVLDLRTKLSFFPKLKDKTRWGAYFQNALSRWKSSDAKEVIKALKVARDQPTYRKIDHTKANKPISRKSLY